MYLGSLEFYKKTTIMEIKYYISQAHLYRKILDKWRVYLQDLQTAVTSNNKSAIKLTQLTDRIDLIRWNGLEEQEYFTEIKAIHKLIKKEKEIYDDFLKSIKEPENVSLFTLKSKAKSIRNEKFEKIFKKLLSINSEQTTRLNLFIKNLELLAMKNAGDLAENKKEQEVKNISKIKDPSIKEYGSNNQKTSNSIQKTAIPLEKKVITEDTTPSEKTIRIQEEEKTAANSTTTKDVTPKNDESTKDFDYETEMKRILGL